MARLCNSKSLKLGGCTNINENENPSVKCKFRIDYPQVHVSESLLKTINQEMSLRSKKNLNSSQNLASKSKVRFQCHYQERMRRADFRRKRTIQKLKQNYEIDVDGLNENVTREIIMKAEMFEKEKKQREKRNAERMVTMMSRLIQEQKYKLRGTKIYSPPWRKTKKKSSSSARVKETVDGEIEIVVPLSDLKEESEVTDEKEWQTEALGEQNLLEQQGEEIQESPECRSAKKEEKPSETVYFDKIIRKPRNFCINTEQCLESIPKRVIFNDYKKNKVYLKGLKIMNIGWETIHCRYLGIVVHTKGIERFPVGVAVRDNVKLRPGLCCSTKIRLCSQDDSQELQCSVVYETRREKNPLKHSWFFVPVICVPVRAIVKVVPLKIIFPSLTWCEATGPEGSKLLCKTLRIENSGGKACSCKVSKTQLYIEDVNPVAQEEAEEAGEAGEVEEGETECVKTKSNKSTGSNSYNENIDYEQHLGEDYFLPYGNIEETIRLLVDELFENVFAIFRFSVIYYIELPPFTATNIQLRFIPHYKGFHHEMYYLQFEDCDNCREQAIEIVGDIKQIPLRVEPQVIDLKTCIANSGVYAGTFKVFNESKCPYSVILKIPPSLKNHAHVYPKATTILPLNFFIFSVRIYPRVTLARDTSRYYNTLSQVLEFPISIHPSNIGACKRDCIKIYVLALVTDYCLELSPSSINFGAVSTLETVRADFQLTNHSLALQEYGFLNLPKGVRVEPNMGFGKILPKEIITLHLLYSPGEDLLGCEEGHEFQVEVTSIAKLGGFGEELEPDKESTSKSIEFIWGEDYGFELSGANESSYSENLFQYMQPEDSEEFDVCEEESSIDGEELCLKLYEQENKIREFLKQGASKTSQNSYLKRMISHDQNNPSPKPSAVDNRGESFSVYGECEEFGLLNEPSAKKSCVYVINCRALIVQPHCRISASVIQLPAASCSSFSLYRFRLDCIKQGGDINCPCGFKKISKCGDKRSESTFEFQYSCSQIKLEPQSGSIKPGDSLPITVIHRPEFSAEQLQFETRINKTQKSITDAEKEMPSLITVKSLKGKQVSPKNKVLESTSKNMIDVAKAASFELGSNDLFAGEKNLAKFMSPFYVETKIRCVVKTKICEDHSEKTEVHEMVLICPAIKPNFIYLGNSQEIKFNKVFVGTKCTKHLQIQNISFERVAPSATLLNPVGPFYCPAGIRRVEVDPEHIWQQPLTYMPLEEKGIEKQFFEIYCGTTNISLIVSGEGMRPDFRLTPNFGCCLMETKLGNMEDLILDIDNHSTITLHIFFDIKFVKEGPELEEDRKSEEEVRVKKDNMAQKEEVKEAKKGKTVQKDEKRKSKNSGNESYLFWDQIPDYISSGLEKFENVREVESKIFTLLGIGDDSDVQIPPAGKQQVKVQFKPPSEESVKTYAMKCELLLENVSLIKEFLVVGKIISGNEKNQKIN